MATDKAGNVFVAEGEVVDVFSSSGKFETAFGAGIIEGEVTGLAADAAGRVYVAEPGAVDVFKPNGSGGYVLLSQWTGAGTPAEAFAELGGIAVDNSTSKSDPSAGDVYVLDRGEAVVYAFQPKPEGAEEANEGKFVTKIKGKFEEPVAVAVDSNTGRVYVAENVKHVVDEFPNAEGKIEATKIVGSGTPTKAFGSLAALAVEEATGDVYVADGEGKAVDQFTSTGEWIGWLTVANGAPFSESLRGLAVAPSGQLYVASGEPAVVDVFGPNVLVPTVKTAKETKLTRTSATLNGSINTEGKPTKYHFEYGEAEGAFTSTPVTSAAEGLSKVSAAVTGLKAGGFYEFRLVAENEDGTSYGANLLIETPPAVTGLVTGAASGIEPTTATLNGLLEPEALATKYRFEYGETNAYGKVSPEPDAETSGTGIVPVTSGLKGLKPNTTYHFRLSATNGFGTTLGNDAKFKTSGPPTITNGATTAIGHTNATINAQINPGKLATKYHIVYGETGCEGGTSTSEAEIPAGENAVPIKAELTGLKLATTYHFCIVASNAATEPGPPVVSAEREFTTVLIDSASAREVKAESAVLQTQINPLGKDTTYHFEYGETTAYGTSIPVPDKDLGKGEVDVSEQQEITGLHPGTTYHFRVVATVEGIAEKGVGADHTFTTPITGGSFELPDGRAYEMVSPPDKHGGYIEPITRNGGAVQASEDGNALTFVVNGPIVESPEGNRSPEAQQVISTRGAGAWSSQEIVTPHERPWGLRAGRPPEYQMFSPDLSVSLVQPFPYALTPLAEPALAPPLSEAERGHQEKTMYLRNDAPISPGASEATIYNEAKHNGETLAKEHGEAEASPGYLPLVTAANVPPGTTFGGRELEIGGENLHNKVEPNIEFVSASPDLSHVVIRSHVQLVKGPPSAPGLYEWAAGKLQLVSVLPSGAPAEGGLNGILEIDLGFGFPTEPTVYRHAISQDGSRVVWTKDETIKAGLGHLYLRDTSKAETIQLDAPEKGLPEPKTGEAQFQTASADGSRVFFSDAQRLTADATASPAKADLYECEVVETSEHKLACRLTDLTVDPHGGESAAVQGAVLGSSEDGSYLYFVATGALAAGAEAGANNLYVLHNDGTKWTTRFIAQLSNEDNPDWFTRNRVDLVNLTARVSPDGSHLAFMSSRRLTGYNNVDVNEQEGQHADEEVFLYSAGSATVACASCNPSGARPRGVFDQTLAGEGGGLLVDRPETWKSGNLGVDHWLAGSIPGWTPIDEKESNYQSSYLSNTGRLFFTSADPLVPQAAGHTRLETINGKETPVGVENVYQYEPNEVGSCKKSSGCVALISNAASNKESAFLDASPSGNDVFLLTAAKLLPQDEDSSYDIYDARVCGESGCQVPHEPPPPPCASAEECRGGSSTPPTFQAPPTSTFSGPGNTTHAVGGTLPSKTTKPPPLTNAQKLALALKTCKKLPHRTRAQKHKRATCEAQAKRKYGPKKAKKSSRHKSKTSGRKK